MPDRGRSRAAQGFDPVKWDESSVSERYSPYLFAWLGL